MMIFFPSVICKNSVVPYWKTIFNINQRRSDETVNDFVRLGRLYSALFICFRQNDRLRCTDVLPLESN